MLRAPTGLLAVLLPGLLLAGCSDPAPQVQQELPEQASVVLQYDATLEPSAAVLALVPTEAQTLVVNDFEQLRLTLGFSDLDSASPAADRARYLRALGDSVALADSMLREVDDRLRADFGFGADDVSWEARFRAGEGAGEGAGDGAGDGTGTGWVIAFSEDVGMDSVQRAVRAGVGPLAGAVVNAERHYVTSGVAQDAQQSWGAEPDLVELAGRKANATFVGRGCLDFATVFGAGTEDDLAAEPAAALDELDELDGYAVALGPELGTVLLGIERGDTFDRMRIAEVLPRTRPEFGTAFGRPVGDPSTGRIGYEIARPVVAADLVTEGQLPFAVCAP